MELQRAYLNCIIQFALWFLVSFARQVNENGMPAVQCNRRLVSQSRRLVNCLVTWPWNRKVHLQWHVVGEYGQRDMSRATMLMNSLISQLIIELEWNSFDVHPTKAETKWIIRNYCHYHRCIRLYVSGKMSSSHTTHTHICELENGTHTVTLCYDSTESELLSMSRQRIYIFNFPHGTMVCGVWHG